MSALNTPETSSTSTVAAGVVDSANGATQPGAAPTGSTVGVLERVEGAETTSPADGFTTAQQTGQPTQPIPSAQFQPAQPFQSVQSIQSVQPVQSSAQQAHPAGTGRSTLSDRDNTTQTLGIIAFVLAMAAIVTPSFVLLPIAALVLGIIALVRKPRSKAFALTGVIVSGVMLAGSILVALGAAFFFGIASLAGSVF